MSLLCRSAARFLLAGLLAAPTAPMAQPNLPPVFDPIPPQKVAEGRSLSLAIRVSDPNNDPIRLTARSLAPWMRLNGSVLTATPGSGTAGSYRLTFVASDGRIKTWLKVPLTVMPPNRPPVLEALDALRVGPGDVLSIQLSATDPDGDSVSFSLVNRPPWVTLDGTRLVARPRPTDLGQFALTVVASDGNLTDQEPVTVTVAAGAGGFPPPWNAYFGSQDNPATWSRWVRGVAQGLAGLNALQNPSLLPKLTEQIANKSAGGREVMVQTTGFSGDQAGSIMNLMTNRGAAEWQDSIIRQLGAIATVDPEIDETLLQNGNEITKDDISIAVRDWARAHGIYVPGQAGTRDPQVIPFYVEYYFAPTVEAIREASLLHFGDPHRIPVVLGSIGNIVQNSAKAWLDQLLSYRVEGTFASGLAGKRVYELVDIITVHYPHENDNLAEVWKRWKGVGRVRGLWTTEDIGVVAANAGVGAATAVRQLGRHLSFYYQQHLLPEEARVSFFEWESNGGFAGTAADIALTAFHAFFGDAPLEVLRDAPVGVIGQIEDPEFYVFRSLDDPRRAALTITTDAAGSLDRISVAKLGWTGPATATVHVFSVNGHAAREATVIQGSDAYTVIPSSRIACGAPRCSLLVTLSRL